MMTGFVFVLAGLVVLFYPQVLILMISGVFIVIGLGIMITSWQFRRLRKQSGSTFMNWIIRY